MNAHLTIHSTRTFTAIFTLIVATLMPTHFVIASQEKDTGSNALAYITQTLAMPAFSGGSFKQTRTLAGFTHPLQSTGRYYYWEKQGLYWETNTPFFRASTFSPSRIISWSAPGVISSSEKPGLIQKEINKVLTALLSGDISALSTIFSVQAEAKQASNTWNAELTPKNPTTRKVITAMTLSGGKVLQQLRIQSANGDSTHIIFNDNIASATPTPEQCTLFLPEEKDQRCQPATR